MKSDPKFPTYIYSAPPKEEKKEPQTDDQLLSPEGSNRKAGTDAGDPDGDIQLEDLESQKKVDKQNL